MKGARLYGSNLLAHYRPQNRGNSNHAFPVVLPGGFVGVDIFFVISGYLISGLLLREWNANVRIDLVQFWQRRIRRILLADSLVMVATAIVIVSFPILDGRQLGRHILSAALFYHNVRFAGNVIDYLTEDHGLSPLLHYRSLSVEEQFYAAWPLALLALLYSTRRFGGGLQNPISILVVGMLIVLSFGYSLYLLAVDRAWAFFGTVPAAWQLLTGAFLSWARPTLHAPSRRLANTLVISVLAAIAVNFVLILIETRSGFRRACTNTGGCLPHICRLCSAHT